MNPLLRRESSAQGPQTHLLQPATTPVYGDGERFGACGATQRPPKQLWSASQQSVCSSADQQTLPEYSASIRQSSVWWSWRSAWSMYFPLFLSVGFAVGHHIYYASLHGQPATDQVQRLRYGTLLAFLTKVCLVWSISAALYQRIWTSLKAKHLSLQGVDSLFALADEPLAALDWKTVMNTKVTLLVAAIAWLGPVMVILASQALSVEQIREPSFCPGVKTLNFSQESIEEWRSPTRLEGWYGDTLSFWNNTTPNFTDPNFFDYWDQPNESIKHLANALLIRDGPMPDSSQSTCGKGWDCEFNITFQAPGYKCEHIPTGSSQRFKTPGGAVPPFDESVLVPRGDFSYYSHALHGEYSAMQSDSLESGGVITTKPPFPKDLGTFRTEPIIWVGYSTVVGSGKVPRNRTMPGWDEFFVPKMLYCELFETEYTVEFKYVQQAQASRVLDRKYIAPIINTTYDPKTIAHDGTMDPITAYPKDRYVYPHEKSRYRYVAAYHSVGAAFRYIVNGTIDSKQVDQPIYGETKVWMTKMVDLRNDFLPVPDLMETMQGLFENILISMINRPDLFLVVSWAADASRISGGREGDETTMYACIKTKPENRFRYNSVELGVVYGLSVILATVTVGIGTAAVIRNGGILKNTRFSSIATLLQHCGYSLDIYRQLE